MKTTRLLDDSTSSKNNNNKPAFSRNNGSRSLSRRNNKNGKIKRFGDISINYAEKLKKSKTLKLFNLRKSKSEKLTKSRKLSKCENPSNLVTKEVGPNFLISDTRKTFNNLWLIFTKAPIFQYLSLKYYI